MRETGEEFAAVEVHAEAAAEDDFACIALRSEGETDARANAPLTAGESRCGGCLSRGELVVRGDDEAAVDGLAVGDVEAFGIEVEDVAVLFGEAAVVVVAYAEGEAEGAEDLPLVLEVGSAFVGAVVAVGIAGEDVAAGDLTFDERDEVGGREASEARAQVANVELGVVVVAASGEGVFAERVDGIGGGVPAVLEVARVDESAVGAGGYTAAVGVSESAEREAGESGRPGEVDAEGIAAELGAEVTVDLLAGEPEALLPVEARADGDGVADGRDLGASVLSFRKAEGVGVGEGAGGGRVLVVVLEGEAISAADVVVEGGACLVTASQWCALEGDVGRAGNNGGRICVLSRWNHVLTVRELGLQDRRGDRVDRAIEDDLCSTEHLCRIVPGVDRVDDAGGGAIIGEANGNLYL